MIKVIGGGKYVFRSLAILLGNNGSQYASVRNVGTLSYVYAN